MVTKHERSSADPGDDVGVAASAGVRVSRPDPVKAAVARSARFIYWWAALAVVLVIALGASGLAWAASQRSTGTARCVNDVLATRNGPSTAEVDAQIRKAEKDLAALHQIASAPATGLTAYTDSTRQYITALKAIKAERDAHPLGRC